MAELTIYTSGYEVVAFVRSHPPIDTGSDAAWDAWYANDDEDISILRRWYDADPSRLWRSSENA